MENIRKEAYEINDSELEATTGGAAPGGAKYPIGTPVLETEFTQEIGQDSGEVVAYACSDGGKYTYIVRWRIKGEKKHTESEIEKFYRCWDLSQ